METRVLPVDPERPDPATLRQAATSIENGGLVAVPTETVYGIAAHPDRPDAVKRLIALKGARGDKPFSYHIGDVSQLAALGVTLPPFGQRLADRYWPGPLTLVLDRGDETIGVRCVGHTVARDLLLLGRAPLFMSSANRSDQPPATDAETVRRELGSELALILDAGPSQLKSSSTVVRVTDLRWEILREGFLTREMIVKTVDRLVLFVCSGNTCRSPMAKALAQVELSRRAGVPRERSEEGGTRFESAGVYAVQGDGASPHAKTAVESLGGSLDNHRSQPLTPELAAEADEIYAMSKVHMAAAQDFLPPEQREKVKLLDPEGREIPDPFGGDLEIYTRTAHHIHSLVRALVQR
ncbi:MAG: L-threonylcarbamoyladenylate synthase [Planctomycetota bacterium]